MSNVLLPVSGVVVVCAGEGLLHFSFSTFFLLLIFVYTIAITDSVYTYAKHGTLCRSYLGWGYVSPFCHPRDGRDLRLQHLSRFRLLDCRLHQEMMLAVKKKKKKKEGDTAVSCAPIRSPRRLAWFLGQTFVPTMALLHYKMRRMP